MFIDVTRVGGERSLRLAVAAIAYMDATPQGCALHLVGGQSLHVEQSPAAIEDSIALLTEQLDTASAAEAAPSEPAPILLLEHKPHQGEADTGAAETGSSADAGEAPAPAPSAPSAAKPTRHHKRGRR